MAILKNSSNPFWSRDIFKGHFWGTTDDFDNFCSTEIGTAYGKLYFRPVDSLMCFTLEAASRAHEEVEEGPQDQAPHVRR